MARPIGVPLKSEVWVNASIKRNGLIVLGPIAIAPDKHAIAVAHGMLIKKPNVPFLIPVAIIVYTSEQLIKIQKNGLILLLFDQIISLI